MDLSNPITIDEVWKKGRRISGLQPTIWRNDDFDTRIKYDEYGNRDSKYGWEIDHIKPAKDGGNDELSNLRPLQWKNNVERN